MPISPEVYLISSVLRDADVKVAMKNGVTSNMFHAHQDEWAWIETYFSKHRKTPTKTAFKAAFPEFRIKAVNDTGHFSDEVRRGHARHELTGAMREAADFIANGDIETAVAKVQAECVSIAAGMGTINDGDILSMHDDIMADIAERRRRYEEQGSAGVPTGFPTLDERTGGAQPGEVWIFGARLGEGKSWILQQMAAAAVCGGYKVQFDALEQTRAQVGMRIYSLLAGQGGKATFDSMALMQGKDYDPRQFRAFIKGLKQTIAGNLFVSDATRGRVSALTVASQIERNKVDIAYIDYLTLMQKHGPDWQGVAQLSADLVMTAGQYGIPIIAASQLNREHGLTRKGEPPGPEALAQADAIGQDASVIVNMSKMSQSVMVAKCVKNRNGIGGFKFYIHTDFATGRIKEVSYNKAMDLIDFDKEREEQEKENSR